jgi:D-glycerate 3-kinase
VNGTQGSGKSTLSDLLVHLFKHKHHLSAVCFSLDDFYLSRQQREDLATEIHPLFKTRGVPGTHDLALAIKTLKCLLEGKATRIPRFNKAIDDRYDQKDWTVIDKPVDIIIFEGWCLGAQAQSEQTLTEAINDLESEEDASLRWRSYINQQLLGPYQHLFSYIDQWVMLKAPSFECVYQWRLEQEDKLKAKLAASGSNDDSGVMNENEVARFIKFYQRITTHLLVTLPAKVHHLFELDEKRQVVNYQQQNVVKEGGQNLTSLLIFTDMDGSLLNHDTYDFSDAMPVMENLKQSGVPVIPCTSKTAAELFSLRIKLDNPYPFIVENGAAVFIPIGTFLKQPDDTIVVGNYWVKEFTQPRSHWLALLQSLNHHYEGCYKGFSQMTLAEIIEATGLDETAAQESSQRDYGEPLMWQGTEQQKTQFVEALTLHGATILQGGRFIHVCGDANKGQALRWLTAVYQTMSDDANEFVTVAIGDSHNDIAMLETADMALLIRSPSHELPKLNRTHDVYVSDAVAPLGWKQGVEKILGKLTDLTGGTNG